jgi:hypothetical protein
MNLPRHMIVAGLAALSLGVAASPAAAKGGGDGFGDATSGVVTFISPDLVIVPTTNSGSGSSGGGGGKCCKFSGGVLLNGA